MITHEDDAMVLRSMFIDQPLLFLKIRIVKTGYMDAVNESKKSAVQSVVFRDGKTFNFQVCIGG